MVAEMVSNPAWTGGRTLAVLLVDGVLGSTYGPGQARREVKVTVRPAHGCIGGGCRPHGVRSTRCSPAATPVRADTSRTSGPGTVAVFRRRTLTRPDRRWECSWRILREGEAVDAEVPRRRCL